MVVAGDGVLESVLSQVKSLRSVRVAGRLVLIFERTLLLAE